MKTKNYYNYLWIILDHKILKKNSHTNVLKFVATKFSPCSTFYQFVLTKSKNVYSLHSLKTQNSPYLEQTHRHVHTKMQIVCHEN